MKTTLQATLNPPAPAIQLSARQQTALEAICDTIIPFVSAEDREKAAFWQIKASDLQIAQRIKVAIARQSPEDQQEFKQLLNVFTSPLAGLLFTGKFKSFASLQPAGREQWLQYWASSNIGLLRKGFSALQQLTCFLFYSDTTVADPNPVWKHIGYPGPVAPPPPRQKTIAPLTIRSNQTLHCQVVVVGSGAGGGVVAGEMAKAGKDVIVVEKGGYYSESDFSQKEAEMIGATYEKSGLLSSKSGSITIFAGSCLGGGTTINWAGTLKTPDYVLQEWAEEHQNPHFLTGAYKQCLDDAAEAISANTDTVPLNRQNQILWEGSTKLGQHVKKIPQNIVAPAGANELAYGYSCFGDQYGYKQSMLNTCLRQAAARNARFLVNTEVQQVLVEGGKATGVLAVQTDSNGQKHQVKIMAEKVVVAAGSIHTPALLKRSGLQHPQIGRNLHLHPVISASGIYSEEVDCWWGGMMTVANDQFTCLDGNYGFKLETPPAHSGLIGFSLPWTSGKAHKELMLQARHLSNIIILTRDKFGGTVKTDLRGQPVVHYNIHPYDLNHLVKGLEEAIRIHQAAGANFSLVPHHTLPIIRTGDGTDLQKTINSLKWKPNMFPMFSAHQMGTCRTGGNRETHPLAPNGETWEVKNLYVADGSAFPNASGANPMLSIEAMALFTARGML